MGYQPKSVLDLSQFDAQKIDEFFQFADGLIEERFYPRTFFGALGLIFFEPSTRTRLSFEFAAARAGLQALHLGDERQSSIAKGETSADTIFTLAAMRPKALVIRAGDDLPMAELASQTERKFGVPIINAGWGKKSHPTQALLDFYTIRKSLGRAKEFKFLFVGDLKHSRVFASHLELAEKLNVQVGVCSPPHFATDVPGVEEFETLESGLAWADVVMMLRYQRERHANKAAIEEFQTIHENYGLTKERLAQAHSVKTVLHPGPFERGVEIANDTLGDSRCAIWDQVQYGVLIREALLRMTTGVGM